MNGNETKTYYCRSCDRTFTDAGVFISHNCDAPQPRQRARSLTQSSARMAEFFGNESWMAIDASFGEWMAQRQAVRA